MTINSLPRLSGEKRGIKSKIKALFKKEPETPWDGYDVPAEDLNDDFDAFKPIDDGGLKNRTYRRLEKWAENTPNPVDDGLDKGMKLSCVGLFSTLGVIPAMILLEAGTALTLAAGTACVLGPVAGCAAGAYLLKKYFDHKNPDQGGLG